MTIRLVSAGWERELSEALRADAKELRIICPFIKVGALDRLLSLRPARVQVITRFNLADFAEGVSDIQALRRLRDVGASVRGIRNLHAKVYLFGASRAIITSANLTEGALTRNQEFGVVTDDSAAVATCRAYFDALWRIGRRNLSLRQIASWDETVTCHRASAGRTKWAIELGDFGADASISANVPVPLPAVEVEAGQAFVKFLGTSENRAPVSFPTIEEVERAGCHWAVAYPPKKRPRAVKNGAVIFIARLTDEPDTRVFGRAIGRQHKPGHDDATPEEIAHRPFKEKWPIYIRVDEARFVAGTMANGVSLNDLMATLGADSFRPTQRNAAQGSGNTDPRRAYMQQAAVELSPEGHSWLSERLQAAFDEHGEVSQDMLDRLDWPILPTSAQAATD